MIGIDFLPYQDARPKVRNGTLEPTLPDVLRAGLLLLWFFYILARMRKSLFLLAIPVVFTALAIAQISDDEYKTLMQSIGANVTAIRNSADTAAAAPAATNLVEYPLH